MPKHKSQEVDLVSVEYRIISDVLNGTDGEIPVFFDLKDALLKAQEIGPECEVWVDAKIFYVDDTVSVRTAYVIEVMWQDTPENVIHRMFH